MDSEYYYYFVYGNLINYNINHLGGNKNEKRFI